MKALDRKVAAIPPECPISDRDEFCVCRMLEDCALIKIESLARLREAKKSMRRVAFQIPGSYVVFSKRSKRVLGRIVTHASA